MIPREAWVERPLPRRGQSDRVVVKLPWPEAFAREWLHAICGHRTRPTLLADGRWAVARVHYPALLRGFSIGFDVVHVREEHAEAEACTVACSNADPSTADFCTCCCLGMRHGILKGERAPGAPGRRSDWILVGEQFVVQWATVVREYEIRRVVAP